MIELAIF